MKENLLEVNKLKKYFPIKKGVFKKLVGHVKAVDSISFFIKRGETVGLVGESGCGKSTTGRLLMRLLKPTAGSIFYQRENKVVDLAQLYKDQLKKYRKDIQIIFQDPFSSLDPRLTVRDIIAEPLKIQNVGSKKERTDRVEDLLLKVGLNSFHMNRYPHEFSGGQRQRIGIARSLALNPSLIICDEPVSALDVSVQAQVLNLLSELQSENGYTYLFIAHDLSVVEHISDRVMVMYLGKIIEMAKSKLIYQQPAHPYTEALLAAIPIGDPRSTKVRLPLEGSVPNPADPPSGCNFHTRCPYAKEVCREKGPVLLERKEEKNHFVACHFVEELQLEGYDQLRVRKSG